MTKCKYHVGCLTTPTNSPYPQIRFVTDLRCGVPRFNKATEAATFTSDEADRIMHHLLKNGWLAVTIRVPADRPQLCTNKEETKC